jgi:hypothetical protein
LIAFLIAALLLHADVVSGPCVINYDTNI